MKCVICGGLPAWPTTANDPDDPYPVCEEHRHELMRRVEAGENGPGYPLDDILDALAEQIHREGGAPNSSP